VHALRAENAHEIVLQRQEELRSAWVALPARSPAQLIVDTAAFVPLRANNIEPAGVDRLLFESRDFPPDRRLMRLARFLRRGGVDLLLHPHFDVAAKLNVRAAPGHVCCDGNRARNARLSDDEGFLLVETRVEDGEILR